MVDTMADLAPPSRDKPPVTLDPHTYPHIFESILRLAPYGTLIAMRACSRAVRDNIDIHLARHLVLQPQPGSPAELRVTSGSGLVHPAFAFWKSVVDYDDLDDNVSDSGDGAADPYAAETRREQAAKRHCLAIARYTEVLDLCEAPPYGSVVPLAQGLKNVHVVRLRRDPGQYPYPQITAPTRVVFTGGHWQRMPETNSLFMVDIDTRLPHHKRYVVNVVTHRKGPAGYTAAGWTLPAENPELEEMVVRLSIPSDDPAHGVVWSQPQPERVRTSLNVNIFSGVYQLPPGARITVVGRGQFDSSFHGPEDDPRVAAFQASPDQPSMLEERMRADITANTTNPDPQVRFMTHDEFRDSFDDADRYALETNEYATVGYRPVMKTEGAIKEE